MRIYAVFVYLFLYAPLAVIAPLLTIDLVFLSANLLKLLSGGFVPLVIGGAAASGAEGESAGRAGAAAEAAPVNSS